jgi:hypothetical protein
VPDVYPTGGTPDPVTILNTFSDTPPTQVNGNHHVEWQAYSAALESWFWLHGGQFYYGNISAAANGTYGWTPHLFAIGLQGTGSYFAGATGSEQVTFGFPDWTDPMTWNIGVIESGGVIVGTAEASIGIIGSASNAGRPEELNGRSGGIFGGFNGQVIGVDVSVTNLDPIGGHGQIKGSQPTVVNVSGAIGPSDPGPVGGVTITDTKGASISLGEACSLVGSWFD